MSEHAISHHTDPREFVQQDLARHDDKALKIDLREIYKQDDKLTSASDRDQTMGRDYVQLKELGVSDKQLREAGFPASDVLLKHMVRDNDRSAPMPGMAAAAGALDAAIATAPLAAEAVAGAGAAADAPPPSRAAARLAPLDMHDWQRPTAVQDHTRVVHPPVPQFAPRPN